MTFLHSYAIAVQLIDYVLVASGNGKRKKPGMAMAYLLQRHV